MLKIQEIREIIKLIDESSIEKFSYEADGAKLVLKKGSSQQVAVAPVVESVPAAKAAVVAPEPIQVEAVTAVAQAPVVEKVIQDPTLHEITSPMVGTFYASSSPDVEAYVQSGAKVNEDSIVCIVEAMKLFNEIEAEVSGEIVEILAKDGQLVEYGQPLFLVKTK